ncbi:helix-turn-helix transcriptional regulator [Laribacter hongkongensis]|uniref:XRE family transcriptional regulator n=1 Tax=Laribacter hongkongensis TaxID=168471 RepID=UPI001EFE7756|nr:helix-turn-helix transcriptional regulator [Laribacter hongkongensis]MCG8996541.1 helix-turn-helix transcriptional regulator [Laribacter hongkongensis]MCG9009304.1 helix-turn-helix transcriptional regulator [Laribacter hongkongensis]MCG9022774.1 helix-turn-helix transcriptional regulator [Laribacter hongkongensis]MCG9047705.1 helix-turn-helix transcriptional regulator [Laribacter hongkongensis]MCG9074270.1 helix-turn-helix transcriptional regulator [Laribacter hongkongensis]
MSDSNLYDDFMSRVSEAIALAGGPTETSRRTGVTLATLTRWKKGEADPSRTNLVRLAEASGVSVAWLATGEGRKLRTDQPLSTEQSPPAVEPTDEGPCPCVDTLGNPVNLQDFVFIPRYNLKASAGHGRDANGEKPIFSMAFRRYWIDNFLRIDPHDLSVISVKGDSMEGVLNDRDVILINHADNAPKDGLYVLRIDGDLVVKRLQRKPGGKIGIISANEAYAPYDIDLNDLPNDFAIVGRVVWFGRQL